MPTMHHHRSPRWLNARLRLARLTIPQWLAVASAAALGAGLYFASSVLPLPFPGGGALYLRLLLAGPLTGLLGVLFYALADDRREPFIRQAVFYLLRRHRYPQGGSHASLYSRYSRRAMRRR